MTFTNYFIPVNKSLDYIQNPEDLQNKQFNYLPRSGRKAYLPIKYLNTINAKLRFSVSDSRGH